MESLIRIFSAGYWVKNGGVLQILLFNIFAVITHMTAVGIGAGAILYIILTVWGWFYGN